MLTVEQQRRSHDTRRELAAELRLIAWEHDLAGEYRAAHNARVLAIGVVADSPGAVEQGCEVLIAGLDGMAA